MPDFKIHSEYKMMGDQPQAVEKLVAGIKAGKQHQVLLGVTGERVIIVTGCINALAVRVSETFIRNKSCIA